MKRILFTSICMLFITSKSFGQITLDNTFNTNGTALNIGGYDYEVIYPQYLSSGLKYFKINYSTNLVHVYNDDYSIHSTLTLPVDSAYKMQYLWHFTDKLFDSDDEIEYLYEDYEFASFRVYNADASMLFAADSCYPITFEYFNTNYYGGMQSFINFSASDSTFKMALREFDRTANTTNIKIYTLPGTLPMAACCCTQGLAGIQQNNPAYSGISVYPNPSSGFNVVQLPQNINAGEIIVYNMQGDEISRIGFTEGSKEVEINNNMLTSGTYFYKLTTNDGNLTNLSKKILIVK